MDRISFQSHINHIFASIDIGTNTVLMLIAEANEYNKLNIIYQEYDVARLGEGVDNTKLINDDAFNRLYNILSRYIKKCNELRVKKIFVSGTSALRDAENGKEIIDRIKNELNIKIEIISGTNEAIYSYNGAVNSKGVNFLIDIGGGSTEFIIGQNDNLIFRKSINIGAVRLTERYFTSQPPNTNDVTTAENYISKIIQDEIISEINDISIDTYHGVAGTVTTIATSLLNLNDHEVDRIDGFTINKEDLNKLYQKFLNSETEIIINNFGVHPKRADLISAGTLILKVTFDILGIQNMIASSKGLRFGFLMHKLKEFFHK